MLIISSEKSSLISKIIIAITSIINIGALFILPDQILVQVNQSHTMSKFVVLAMISIFQIIMFNIQKERGTLGTGIIGIVIILVVDIAVIGMNLI